MKLMRGSKMSESEFSQRVRTLSITFDSNHIMCVLQNIGGTKSSTPFWKHDLWHVSAKHEGKVFHREFCTGLGHRVLRPNVKKERGGWYDNRGAGKMIGTEEELIARDLLVLPCVNVGSLPSTAGKRDERMFGLGVDFLYSSFSDASCADQSFKSWADDYGYSDDSISALKAYIDCQDIRDKLLHVFGRELFVELSSL
jgi:hypothetical protein